MREIMKQFVDVKRRFRGDEPDSSIFRIDLPKQFKDLDIEGVIEQGELRLIR
jgi:hypothetical protein